MTSQLKNLSLLWRILLSTSIAVTVLFGLTGWVVQNYAVRVSEFSIEEEVRTSVQSYEALWTARTRNLASLSRMISSMSDVRSAFMTGDQATIQDTAQELWSRVSEEDAVFLVLSPSGTLIASLGGNTIGQSLSNISLQAVRARFPAQVSGFYRAQQRLFYVVLTPVYVQSGIDKALLNILLAGFEVNDRLALSLKTSTRGSDFIFLTAGRPVASTMRPQSAPGFGTVTNLHDGFQRVRVANAEYVVLATPLADFQGSPIGELRIVRSFAAARNTLSDLQRNVAAIWLVAILIGFTLTYLLARRIVEPVKQLDRAASEVARNNYDCRVPDGSNDELGRLARTFNEMCESIRGAREELIRQERISTIGRLSTSIVHDLRNPLAAIYGGAEMLIDSDLSPTQAKRLAQTIYRASRRIQELLQDLANISRGKNQPLELCRLVDVVSAAQEVIVPAADSQSVRIKIDVPDTLELPLERARMERVFLNLMNNSLEAMPAGGELSVTVKREFNAVLVQIDDSGCGISREINGRLFQPFVSVGKKNGLGLGLVLSRQTALDHGGDLWVEEKATAGARFCIRLPAKPPDPV